MTQSLRPIGDAIVTFMQALAGTSAVAVQTSGSAARSAVLARMQPKDAFPWQSALAAAQLIWEGRDRLPEGEDREAFSAALAHADELLEHLVARAYGLEPAAPGKAVA